MELVLALHRFTFLHMQIFQKRKPVTRILQSDGPRTNSNLGINQCGHAGRSATAAKGRSAATT